MVQRLRREAVRLKGEIVSISNSSDPYPNLEAETRLTRKCLEILSDCSCKIQIITKSNLVVRDVDLLKKVPSMVAMTVTTVNDATAKILEPYAPPPSQRLQAIEELTHVGVATSVRIDPLIPFVNDNPEKLVRKLASLEVKHITSSTFKVRPDSWRRFSAAMPEVAAKLEPLYFKRGEKVAGYVLLPRYLRLTLMENIRTLAERESIKFGACREGLIHLNTGACDGSWML
jgi:DNA repair photolyase